MVNPPVDVILTTTLSKLSRQKLKGNLIGPEGFRRFRLPEFLDTRHMKVAGCQP
jgi:hypothetical protein